MYNTLQEKIPAIECWIELGSLSVIKIYEEGYGCIFDETNISEIKNDVVPISTKMAKDEQNKKTIL